MPWSFKQYAPHTISADRNSLTDCVCVFLNLPADKELIDHFINAAALAIDTNLERGISSPEYRREVRGSEYKRYPILNKHYTSNMRSLLMAIEVFLANDSGKSLSGSGEFDISVIEHFTMLVKALQDVADKKSAAPEKGQHPRVVAADHKKVVAFLASAAESFFADMEEPLRHGEKAIIRNVGDAAFHVRFPGQENGGPTKEEKKLYNYLGKKIPEDLLSRLDDHLSIMKSSIHIISESAARQLSPENPGR